MAIHKYTDQLKARNRKKKLTIIYSFLGGGFLVLGGVVYFLFFARLFDIRTVTINGPDNLPKTEIAGQINSWLDARIWGIKHRSNSLIFRADRLENILANQFLRVESLHISQKSKHEVEVNVIERQPDGIWCFSKDNKCFYYDSSGLAYEEVPDSEGFIFTKVTDGLHDDPGLGSKIVQESWLKNITVASDLLKKGGLDPVKLVIPENSLDEFDAQVAQGWKIFFSTSTNITDQVNSLFEFLKNKKSSNPGISFEYIDLRIQDRIYYK